MKNLLIVFLFFSTSLFANFNVINIDSDDTLNVRIAPSSHAKKIGELSYTTENLEVIKCKKTTATSSWCKIKFEDKNSILTGWVSENYIVPDIVSLDIIDNERTTFKITKIKNIDKKKFLVDGKVLVAFKYNDKLGTNYVIYTHKLTSYKKGAKGKVQNISLYHFKEKKNKIVLLRKVHDILKCDTEEFFQLSIIENSLSITDINKDGISEITFIYGLNCFNDRGPTNFKLMMLSNSDKYAIRGHITYSEEEMLSEEEHMKKEVKIDEAFKKAPASFLEFAKKVWVTHIYEVC